VCGFYDINRRGPGRKKKETIGKRTDTSSGVGGKGIEGPNAIGGANKFFQVKGRGL